MLYRIEPSGVSGRLPALLAAVVMLLISCQQTDTEQTESTSALEVVQAAIAKELEMEVSLKIDTFRQNDEWVFLSGLPLTASGQPVDNSQTNYIEDIREGFFDDGFVALVRKSRKGIGDWVLVALSLGATDAPFAGWPEQFGVPEELVIP